jgi:sensor c-di-GMP phosphodiesterase-like protein
MSALANVFISIRHSSLFQGALWLALFLGFLVVGYCFVLFQVVGEVSRDHDAELDRIADTRRSAISALRTLKHVATGTPCSRDFLAQMRRVAFLPDGLNEFLYAPNGVVKCSTSQPAFATRVTLGTPDIEGSEPNVPSLWIDRDLGPIGRPGATGTIAEHGGFAVAIPPYTRFQNGIRWLHKELVVVRTNGKVWNVAGEHGLYQRLATPGHPTLVSLLATVQRVHCDGQHCVASRADLPGWARDRILVLSSIVVLAAILALMCSRSLVAWLDRHWSFEARFTRHLNAQTVVVAYQPILDLRSREVSGCEVLARWRDVDGTIVAPDRFIEIVERTGRTAEFTRMIADRAYEELREHVPRHLRLQVNFNAFACDFNGPTLLSIFSRFIQGKRQFVLAIELVEDQQIEFADAQRAIQELGQAGIKIYIDDFGIGYSSIERAATLAVHGVKLDRSFAMSPPDSILGRMLVQVVEMMRTCGRLIVIEGVETETRLDLLRSTGHVDYVQGYVVSRPLGIHDFVRFLAKDGLAWKARDFAAGTVSG